MGKSLLLAEPFHIVSSISDPNDPKGWSGTPKALVDAFRKHIPDVQVHNLSSSLRWKPLYQILNVLSGLGGKQAHRVGLWRRRHWGMAQRYLEGLGPGVFFHLGSSHLPLRVISPGQSHYYFTDYTVELMVNDSPFGDQVPSRYREQILKREEQALRQLTAVFTTADYVKERIVSTGVLPEGQVIAVGSGLGRIPGLEGINKDYSNGHLLFVAKQNFRGKGGYLLLDALDEALKERPALHLVVIGNADDPQACEAIERMKSHPSITFYNWDTPKFRELVQSAALYVGPAHDEPYGIIYLESLLCETPLLGLRRNAFPQFACGGRCGFIVDEETPKAVGAAIVDAMSDVGRLRSMGKRGRQYVEKSFSWDGTVLAILKYIEKAAVGRRSVKRVEKP